MLRKSDLFSRYLPSDRKSRQWGWRIVDAGHQQIKAGSQYPLSGHPHEYLFGVRGERTLKEYQIVLITSGSGYFESGSVKKTRIEAGTAFLLFPGEWHRYFPSPNTGWDEYWVGFDGKDASGLMGSFFSVAKPIFKGAQTNGLIQLFGRQLDLLRNPQPGGEQLIASLIPQQLALLRMSRLTQTIPQKRLNEVVVLAKAEILGDLNKRTDFELLATKMGLSYSRFRKRFRLETGYAPREFENLVRLNHAREMLYSGRYSVSKISEELGYSSVFYFSRAYKKQFGESPSKHLKK